MEREREQLTNRPVQTNKQIYISLYKHAHTHTRARTHARTHAHTHAHAHTHTHTHVFVLHTWILGLLRHLHLVTCMGAWLTYTTVFTLPYLYLIFSLWSLCYSSVSSLECVLENYYYYMENALVNV